MQARAEVALPVMQHQHIQYPGYEELGLRNQLAIDGMSYVIVYMLSMLFLSHCGRSNGADLDNSPLKHVSLFLNLKRIKSLHQLISNSAKLHEPVQVIVIVVSRWAFKVVIDHESLD